MAGHAYLCRCDECRAHRPPPKCRHTIDLFGMTDDLPLFIQKEDNDADTESAGGRDGGDPGTEPEACAPATAEARRAG